MRNELELYQVDLQAKFDADLFSILSSEEQKFAQTIRNEGLKNQHINVRVGLRQILSAYLNQAGDKINIAKTVHGKPYLFEHPDIQFNISHSAERLLVGISKVGAIGVDIEQAKSRQRDFSALVAKCFAPSEQNYWNALPETEKTAEFYRFWTRKEAFVKAVGRGLAMGLQQCEIAAGDEPYFISFPEVYGPPSDWRLFDLPLTADLYGALVIENKHITTNFTLPDITVFEIK